jgi:hypothetical protein
MTMQGSQQPDMPLDVGLKGYLDGSDGGTRANVDMVDAERQANLLDKLVEFVQQQDARVAGANANFARPVTVVTGFKRRPQQRPR